MTKIISLDSFSPPLPAVSAGEKYGRESRVIPVDFSGGFDIYDPLAKELSSLDIGVLSTYKPHWNQSFIHLSFVSVNNVGMTYDCPNNMASVPAEVCCI